MEDSGKHYQNHNSWAKADKNIEQLKTEIAQKK